jgi:hypothetical protein
LNKPVGILSLAPVESKRPFIKITEQVKQLNRNVCPFERAFQQNPKVFDAVGMHVAILKVEMDWVRLELTPNSLQDCRSAGLSYQPTMPSTL